MTPLLNQPEGILGPTVMEIDTRNTKGSPLENNGVLQSVEITDNQGAHALEVIGNALIEESKKLRDKNQSSPAALGQHEDH